MKLSVLGRIGIGLMLAAGVLYGSSTLWWRTRVWCPADVPMSLSSGSSVEVPQFRVNVTGAYEVAIQVQRRGNDNDLSCLMAGGPQWPDKTCELSPVLSMHWTVSSEEHVVAEGTSDAAHTGASASGDDVTRAIGYFDGQKGRRYSLQATSLADATRLNELRPRLLVSSFSTRYEFELLIDSFVKLSSVILASIGVVVIVVAAWRMKEMNAVAK